MSLLPLLLLGCLSQVPNPLLRGRVLDSQGRPREGAEVFVVSPGVPGLREPEVLRLRSGKRGRFRLRLGQGRMYWAWSHFRDEKGIHHFSGYERGLRPGKLLTLREVQARPSQRLRLKKLAAWGKPSAMQVAWNLDGRWGWIQKTPIDAGGVTKVPDELYFGSWGVWFRVLGADGKILLQGKVFHKKRSLARALWKGLLGKGKDDPSLSFFCPKPTSLSIRVETKGSKEPIPGARLLYRTESEPGFCRAETDGKGRAILRVPEFHRSYRSLEIFVVKEGWAGANAFFNQERRSIQGVFQKNDPKKPVREVVFSLVRDQPFRGKVLGLQGKGLTGAVIRWNISLYERKKDGATWGRSGRSGYTKVGKDGSFELSQIPNNLTRMKASLLLSAETWASLFEEGKAPPLPREPLLPLEWMPYRKTPREFTFDFREQRVQPFQVLGPDGAPAAFARLRWQAGSKRLGDLTGRRGRGFLMLPKGEEGVLFAYREDLGFSLEEPAEVPAGERFLLPQKTLNLKPFKTYLRGKVLDRLGRPLAGVRISGAGWSGNSMRPRDHAFAEMNYTLLKGATAKDGTFSLPYLESPNLEFRVRFFWKNRSKIIKIRELGEDLEIRL